jgi:hypothetical protein
MHQRRIVLISTYDQGRQPFGLASPAAWLRESGFRVTCADLSVGMFPARAIREADAVLFFLPMHAATRMAVPYISRVRETNPRAKLGCYGLYAPLNAEYLKGLGVDEVFGAEFEAEIVRWVVDGIPALTSVSLEKLQFRTPDRSGLPNPDRYAKLKVLTEERLVGYTEASRGCKHKCRHCPVVPVYNGSFRVVQQDVVLADIRQQAALGIQHVTFGDPDFWNGPTHAMRIVEAMHAECPELTYDATIKVEHLLQHRDLLPKLRDTGCLFVTSAVESLDDQVLSRLDKGHTRADFFQVVEEFRGCGLTLSPTFIAFHPWTTIESFRDFLIAIRELDLIANVAPIQLALRLLLPAGSRLLELAEVKDLVSGFDQAALTWRWKHPDLRVDELGRKVFAAVSDQNDRHTAFEVVWKLVFGEEMPARTSRAAIPYLTEPWYC